MISNIGNVTDDYSVLSRLVAFFFSFLIKYTGYEFEYFQHILIFNQFYFVSIL